jgi:hypothetical protein
VTSHAKPTRHATQKRRKLPRKFYVGIGAEGGASATLAKVTAAKANGKLGGRPSKSVEIRVGNRTVCISARSDRYGFSKRNIEDAANEFGYHRISGAWTPDDYESAKWVICGTCGDLRRITQHSAQEAHQRKCNET